MSFTVWQKTTKAVLHGFAQANDHTDTTPSLPFLLRLRRELVEKNYQHPGISVVTAGQHLMLQVLSVPQQHQRLPVHLRQGF